MVQDLTEGFMADVEWLRWCLTEGLVGRGEESAAPFFWFVKQPHRRTWFGRFIRGGRVVGPGDKGELETGRSEDVFGDCAQQRIRGELRSRLEELMRKVGECG